MFQTPLQQCQPITETGPGGLLQGVRLGRIDPGQGLVIAGVFGPVQSLLENLLGAGEILEEHGGSGPVDTCVMIVGIRLRPRAENLEGRFRPTTGLVASVEYVIRFRQKEE